MFISGIWDRRAYQEELNHQLGVRLESFGIVGDYAEVTNLKCERGGSELAALSRKYDSDEGPVEIFAHDGKLHFRIPGDKTEGVVATTSRERVRN